MKAKEIKGLSILQELIHEEISQDLKFINYFSLEKIISIYCSEIADIQIKQKENDKWTILIKLPKPMKQVFNRIFRGNSKYEDYWLIESKK